MRILSLTATGRLAERIVRQAGGLVRVEQLVCWLEGLDVDTDRARAGVQLAVIVGRLESSVDEDGNTCVRVPTKRAVA